MTELGTTAADFKLLNVVNNQMQDLTTLTGSAGTVVMFICNHCPFVVHLIDNLVSVTNQIKGDGINSIAISSNNIKTHPQDAPEYMRDLALAKQFSFPYLYDETQQTAKDYNATCTPDFFIFDSNNRLYYRGRFDNSSPGNNQPITGNDLLQACENLIADKPAPNPQYPSMGCSIKWF